MMGISRNTEILKEIHSENTVIPSTLPREMSQALKKHGQNV